MDFLLSNIENYLQGGKFIAFCAVFVAGILSSFTPCIYPMIPITVSIIGGQKRNTRMQSLVLSVAYVLGIATTYSALGIAAVATGTIFGLLSSNPWVLFGIANSCILLGLSMLDAFALPVPGFFSNLRPGGGRFLNVYVMGLIFGLVASPCTAPVLGMILAFVSTTHNYLYGGSLLFVYALGMGALLVVIGTFAGMLSHLPKAGKWMILVKKIFGFIMIAAGEYFLIQAGKMMF